MSKLVLNADCGLYEKKGHAYCTSRQVSAEFGKEHRNVLRDVENLDCSNEFRRLNFEQSSYKNEQGKSQPEVLMTRNGFMFLVMGYRGKKAAFIKETYINRFDHMESFIKSLETAKLEFPEFTEAIMLAHEEPRHYHFSNEINMINKIVLGMTAKEFKEVRGLGDVSSIRPYLTAQEIYAIEKLQKFDIGLNAYEEDFQKRKEILTGYYQRILNIKLLKVV